MTRRFSQNLRFLAAATAIALSACAGGSATDNDSAQDSAGSDGQAADVALLTCKSDTDCAPLASPCETASCGSDGFCAVTTLADSAACDDGDPCTSDTACSNGTCVGKFTCECKTDADCATQEDGNICNGTLYCDTSGATPKCAPNPATIVTCDGSLDTACEKNVCDPKTGGCVKLALQNGTACDDGEACTGPDACKGGNCTGPSSCQCQKEEDCAQFDDGNPCNGTLYCDVTEFACKPNPATVVICPDGPKGGCMTTACDPTDSVCKPVPRPDGTGCDIDGSTCSEDTCTSGSCLPGKLADPCACTGDADCAPFEDGDVCNGTLFCSKASGHCELNPATVVSCYSGDDGPCVKNQCDAKTGQCQLGPVPDGAACDDGWDCSEKESCQKGQCKAEKNLCNCQTSADCAAFANQNKCAQFYCHKPEGVCKQNPATVQHCAPLGDPACSDTLCDPKDGKCKPVPKNAGGPCEADGSFCTNLDTCQGVTCKAASSKCPCQKDTDCKAYDDGDLCNGSLYCDISSGLCEINPATIVSCTGDGEGPCKPDACDPKDGACKPTALPDDVTCDSDDFACTLERCKAGACELVGQGCLCWEDGDCGAFEDDDLCNGKLYCNMAGAPPYCTVNPATVVTCPDPAPVGCLGSACDPKLGVCADKPINAGGDCNDANACTEGDVCDAEGFCKGKPKDAAACDDGNVCTTDACDPGSGCTHTPLDSSPGSLAPCDDGDACTADDACAAGACKGSEPLTCDDGDPCTTDSCDKAKGCVTAPAAAGVACNDGDACATGDACDGKGACAPGKTLKNCDDGKVCTVDGCTSGNCTNTNMKAGTTCSDGDACTGNDACDAAGACKGVGLECDDAKVCTTDTCDKAKGCVYTPVAAGKPCEDGNACTIGDSCDSTGACKAGAPKLCADENVCTADSCTAGNCVFTPTAAGGNCSDGNACTSDDACDGKGVCKGATVSCDDGNPCTNDTCDTAKGCVFAPAPDGTGCSDGNACTLQDDCKGGKCVAPGQLDCNDGELCTNDTCDPAKGCLHVAAVGAACVGGTCGSANCDVVAGAPMGTTGGSVAFARYNKKLYGWGYKVGAMLPVNGSSDKVYQPTPTVLADARLMVVNDRRGCTLDGDGVATCFGLLDASGAKAFGPSPMAGVPKMIWASGRGNDLFLVSADGELWQQDPSDGTKATKVMTKPGGKALRQVAAGAGFGVVLREDGTLWTWGSNLYGQLGVSGAGTTSIATPIQITGASPAAQVCAGDAFACYREAGGKVFCWGRNDVFQVKPTAGNAATPTMLIGTDGANAASQLVCGSRHVCTIVKGNNQVRCWGANDVGQLGRSTTLVQTTSDTVKTQTGTPLTGDATSVLIGGGEATCLQTGAQLQCWGDDSRGLIGKWQTGATTDPFRPAAVTLAGGAPFSGVKELIGGDGAFCARVLSDPKNVESDPYWYCWGRNEGGLGASAGQNLQNATKIADFDGAYDLSVTAAEGCRDQKTGSGGAICWGRNTGGATVGVANGSPVTSLTGVKDITWQFGVRRSSTHACINGDGMLQCWGANGYGQLGDGSKTSGGPTAIQLQGVSSFRVTENISCLRTFDGTLYCTGRNTQGQLGIGSISEQLTFKAVAGGDIRFTDFAVGAYHGCAVHGMENTSGFLESTGSVYCWGLNNSASKNLGGASTAVYESNPQASSYFGAAGQPFAKHVAVGFQTSCVIASDDTLHCFGINAEGSLGTATDGTVPLASQPTQPIGLPKVESVVVGDRTVCAMTTESSQGANDRKVYCWGKRYGGQTGSGVHFVTQPVARTLP